MAIVEAHCTEAGMITWQAWQIILGIDISCCTVALQLLRNRRTVLIEAA